MLLFGLLRAGHIRIRKIGGRQEMSQAAAAAETDPTLDVEGCDTANKLLIIANSVMDGSLRLADVKRQGITHLTAADVQAARTSGKELPSTRI